MCFYRKKSIEPRLEFGKYEEFETANKRSSCFSGRTVANIKSSAKIFVISTFAMFCFLNNKDADHHRTVNIPLNAGLGVLAGIATGITFVRMSS